MKFTLGLPVHNVDPVEEWCSAEAITVMARAAEDAGVDAVNVTDHPIPDAKWLSRGGHHTLDPFVALTVAATATTRVRLQTNLVIVAYRNPFLTAKAVATLDTVSGGRVVVGTGAGYLRSEFAALGVDFDERNLLTDEAIDAMKAAWKGEPFDFEGTHFVAENALALPRPVQRPNPPIWIGGNSNLAIRRSVERADGWLPMPSPAGATRLLRTPPLETLDDLRDRIAYLRGHVEKVGRTDPLDIVFMPIGLDGFREELPEAGPLVEQVHAQAELGVTALSITLPSPSRAAWLENVEWFRREVVAHA
ncbi:TIGR03619 family F420-dependent LLM class oxidoreductase [Rhabdothermincola salaria]|uniref:TIGR03619 family F420-dependent LLM class oxidoreductase n=1 Tax=Rhabdothermincola salaria TaxID=2903142 RepID=UPI001E2C362B|nr:TIGR03619 family F420-dependent LLM class oxidoreductase [Rhabdothermincola salaria]MCD9623765.1 TIGR03619 family F420-dependent LLM class oxidoreductase [Rhabdothermincola salaria]